MTRLQKVVYLSLFGLQLTEKDAVTLGRLRGIERLDLYGVGLSDAAIQQLKQRLKETEIDIRKGGKLGIAGMPLQGQCVIAGIQPGSSAEKAGLLPQDVIIEINGTAISDFGACTRIIGIYGYRTDQTGWISRSISEGCRAGRMVATNFSRCMG